MKLILCNVNPYKKFNKEKSILIKLQIDNSFSWGFKEEDIILATNFDYEYRGVKSIRVSDDLYVGLDDKRYCFKVSTHIPIITSLMNSGVIKKGHLYWYHDLDAYQQEPITEEELGLENVDMGVTDYGWTKKWNLGSIFFKESAKDIFNLLTKTIYEYNLADERSFRMLTNTGKVSKDRYKKVNITYNFGMRHIGKCYEMADKPLKVVHFHPFYKDPNIPDTTMNMFFHGKNEVGKPLMTDRLKELFRFFGFDDKYGTEASYGGFMKSIDYD